MIIIITSCKQGAKRERTIDERLEALRKRSHLYIEAIFKYEEYKKQIRIINVVAASINAMSQLPILSFPMPRRHVQFHLLKIQERSVYIKNYIKKARAKK